MKFYGDASNARLAAGASDAPNAIANAADAMMLEVLPVV